LLVGNPKKDISQVLTPGIGIITKGKLKKNEKLALPLILIL